MFKSLLNKFRSCRVTLSETDFRFAKQANINVDQFEEMVRERKLEGAELNKALCRAALTGTELPLNWWERDDAAQIHARISLRLPALESLSPEYYGRKAQAGERGFLMAAQRIAGQATLFNVHLLTKCTDGMSFLLIEKRLELR